MNAKKIIREYFLWECSVCKELYRFEETAEKCCSPEEIEKYGK